jgi:opacity protein-like surface antigen
MHGEDTMKTTHIRRLIQVFAITAMISGYSSASMAGPKEICPCNRAGNMEFSLPIIYTDSATIEGSGNSSVDLNADWSPGFGIGYDFNEHFLLSGLFNWSSRGYDAEIVTDNGRREQYNGTMDTSTLSLNGTYYFIDCDLTPFVSGGIGLTYIDTNIPSGASQSYCYWDPWWGYVCSSYVPTKSENELSYNAGLGLRWDVTQNFSLQGSYNKMWIDVSNASGGMPDFDVIKMDIIFRSKP